MKKITDIIRKSGRKASSISYWDNSGFVAKTKDGKTRTVFINCYSGIVAIRDGKEFQKLTKKNFMDAGLTYMEIFRN